MPRLRWLHDGNKKADRHMILCHGFGANAPDLAGIAPAIDPENEYAFHFPEAPVPLFQDAWAWFPSDAAELGQAMSGSLWEDLPGYDSPAIGQALDALLGDIEELGITGDKLVLGGFSQGSMMALLAGLSRPCAAIALFSSALFSTRRMEALFKGAPRIPVFMGHGRQDPLLPYEAGRSLQHLLSAAEFEVDFHSFDGGHWIDEGELVAFREFLRRR